MQETRIHNLHYEKFQDGTVKCIEDEIPFDVPEGWEWCRLQSIATIQSSKRVFEKDYVDDGIPFYRSKEIGDLSRNENIRSQLFITEEHYLELKTKYGTPKIGDILITSVGSIGNTWICDGRQFYYKDGNITQIVANSFFVSEYVQLFLKTDFFFEQVGKTVSGSAYNALTIEKLKNILFALPPYDEQQHIVNALIPYNKLIEITESSKEDLLQLIKDAKNRILDLAIRGKLVPQDPNDESASVLLERIRTEKEELIKQGKIKRDKKESFIYRGDDNSYYEKFSDDKERCIDEELLFELPNGWEWCNLSMIGTTNIGLTYRPTDIIDDGTIVLRSSNIVNDKIDLDDLVRVRTQIRDNQYVQPNDILICARNGSKALVGKCALIGNMEEPASFGAFMAVYRTDYYKYVLHYLRSNLFRNVFNDSNSTAINQLTQDMLKRAVIPFPPFEEQQRIVDLIDKLLLQIKNIERSLN